MNKYVTNAVYGGFGAKLVSCLSPKLKSFPKSISATHASAKMATRSGTTLRIILHKNPLICQTSLYHSFSRCKALACIYSGKSNRKTNNQVACGKSNPKFLFTHCHSRTHGTANVKGGGGLRAYDCISVLSVTRDNI